MGVGSCLIGSEEPNAVVLNNHGWWLARRQVGFDDTRFNAVLTHPNRLWGPALELQEFGAETEVDARGLDLHVHVVYRVDHEVTPASREVTIPEC